jgi:methylenetetrahydrofolate reductase (NADPH)
MALPARRVAVATESTETISTLLGGFSLEATFPKQEEIDGLKRTLPAGTRIYLSCLPNRLPEKLIDSAILVRRAGFDPVPHLTARAYPDLQSFGRVLDGLTKEAGVRSALVIAGDRDDQAGPFAGALDLIESGALEASGIQEIDIAGYPDGHPKIGDDLLARSMTQKLDAAAKHGLRVNITTQFCLDSNQIIAWLRRVRGEGVNVPLRVGVAGPTTMRSLMKFALRCGVRASLKGVFNPKALQLFGEAAPDGIIRALAESPDRPEFGAVTIHFFSFGGIVQTAEWADATSKGRIVPNATGFSVIS